MYPTGFLLVIWPPSDCFALYYEYMWTVDGLCFIDVIYGDWSVSDLIFFLTDYFPACVNSHPTSYGSIIVQSAPLVSH